MLTFAFINHICLLLLFRVVPVYIMGYISIPLWLGYNTQLTESTGRPVVFTGDNNFSLVKYLMAGNSTAYCLFELLLLDLADVSNPYFVCFRVLATCSEFAFYFRSYDIVTPKYRVSVLFACFVRILELFSFVLM